MQATCVSAWKPQPMIPSRVAPAPGEVLRRDTARRAGAQLPEDVRLDHAEAAAVVRVEEDDDERALPPA